MFLSDYNNILVSANNIQAKRIPLYEHIISIEIIEKVLNKKFAELIKGTYEDKKEFFKTYISFFEKMGYDTVSFEQLITSICPGSGALYSHSEPVIKTLDDYKKYPWNALSDLFFQEYEDDFQALQEVMPENMKLVGGPGNGIFETVQDLCGYEALCYISIDEPDMYAGMFESVANIMFQIWERFLKKFSDLCCVGRFGDDLGYRSQTLLSVQDIKKHLIPQYKRIVDLIHSYNKPFILHSCGNIFSIMDDLINVAGINVKHSNEDGIAPFKVWIEKYGNQIGNFGGVDADILCQKTEAEIKDYVTDVYNYSLGHGGFAIGSGNSIPEYIPVENYLTMVETVRRLRGE